LATGRAVLQPHTEADMPGNNSSVQSKSEPPEASAQRTFRYKSDALEFSFECLKLIFKGLNNKHCTVIQGAQTTNTRIAASKFDGALI
jgi:hypothetical protein